MAKQAWIDSATHWKATGDVDANGKMTNATVDDNNGIVRDRNRDFSSESAFKTWAKQQQN